MSYMILGGPEGPSVHGQSAEAFNSASGLHLREQAAHPQREAGSDRFQQQEQQQHTSAGERLHDAGVFGGAAAVRVALELGHEGAIQLAPRVK